MPQFFWAIVSVFPLPVVVPGVLVFFGVESSASTETTAHIRISARINPRVSLAIFPHALGWGGFVCCAAVLGFIVSEGLFSMLTLEDEAAAPEVTPHFGQNLSSALNLAPQLLQ